MSGNTKVLDFKNGGVEHCCICGKALSDDEAILDEHDETWCADCLHEAVERYQKMIEQMKKEARERYGK